MAATTVFARALYFVFVLQLTIAATSADSSAAETTCVRKLKSSVPVENLDVTKPLSEAAFKKALKKYPIVFAAFYTPWCYWSQQLMPEWDSAAKTVYKKYAKKGCKILMVKLDCEEYDDLCGEHDIEAYPTMRVFRNGSDEIDDGGEDEHEEYRGERTKEALLKFVKGLLKSTEEQNVDSTKESAQLLIDD